MSRTHTVGAEVVLRSEDAAPDVARKLTDHGIDVLAVGSSSVSIQASPARFEAVFDTQLDREAPTRGPTDFGPLGAEFRPRRPPRVPDDLADQVAAVEISRPPTMMR